MRRAPLLLLASLPIGVLAGAGCCNLGGPSEPEAMGLSQPAETAAPETPAAETPPPPPRRVARMEPGMTAMVMHLPSGQKANSVLRVEKHAPKEVQVGKDFDYAIKLTNLTDAALSDVVLTGRLPANFKVADSTPKADITGQVAKWDVGQLGPRESKTFVARGSATRTGAMVCCSEVTFRNPKFCLTLSAVQPALKVTKTAPAEVILCDEITSKIVVSNTGSGQASNVKVADMLPAGMRTLDGKGAVSFDAGTLGPGQSKEFVLKTKASRTGKYVNKATATADDGLTATSQDAVTTVRQPVLKLTKTAPKMRYVGRHATYVLTVTNKGDAPARDTVLVDTLPANATFVQASEGGRMARGKVTWQLGTLAPGASKTASVTLRMSTRGTVLNLATANAYCAKAADQATTAVKGIPAILLECVDVEDPIEVGAKVTYVITVTNQGSADGTNIVVACTLPAAEEFLSAQGPAKETVKGKQVTFAPLKSLAPKAKAVYRLVVKGTQTGDVRFKVSLTSDQMTSPATESESTHIYE